MKKKNTIDDKTLEPNASHLNTSMNRTITTVRWYVVQINKYFNSLSLKTKRTSLIVFGLSTATICFLLIIKTVISQPSEVLQIDNVIVPKNAYDTNFDRLLRPIGKLIGGDNDSTEQIYLSVDDAGQLYANPYPDFSEAYRKSNGWKLITPGQFESWQQYLRFIPYKK